MPLTPPVLDDRRFADLVAEARTRIPRYTPEWTDLSDTDPGMALVQLFAWMTDATLFRLARVPDLHYIKFLQLLGIELRPAEPAHAFVAFPVQAGSASTTVIVPKGTEVTAEADEPIAFETDEALIAVAARIVRVLSFDGATTTDVTPPPDENTPGEPFQPFGPAAAPDSSLMLGFDTMLPTAITFPRTQLSLMIYSHVDASAPDPVSCGGIDLRPFASAQLAWEYWDRTQWVALALDKDGSLALARSGRVVVRTPVEGTWKRDTISPAPESLFWLRVRVVTASYEHVPYLDAVVPNVVGITQAQTQRDEVLGGTTGRPNQTFKLAFAPVLAESLVLEIDEGDGFRRWTEVRDFFGSGPDQAQYAVNRTTGEVRFGSGEAGRIPVGNIQNPDSNVVAREYRHGGGKLGNVAARAIHNMSGVLNGIDTSGIRNDRAAFGGRDEESLADGLARGPDELKNKDRAVTADDFESLARHVPGVARAFTRPLVNPNFPSRSTPGAVTVVIVPDSDNPAPVPSEGLLRSVCAYLQPRRLLTCEPFLVAPVYQLVRVRADLIASPDADNVEVRKAVESRLLAYLHPLHGGEAGTGWEFGGPVFFSLVYRQVLQVSGVSRIETLVIELDGVEQPACQDVQLDPGSLASSTDHDILVTYAGGSGTP